VVVATLMEITILPAAARGPGFDLHSVAIRPGI
jgi:hypothetical protein